jgi:small subunit ribosomal protein S17
MDKTAVVDVVSIKRHSLYKKTFKKVVKYKVHDEENRCQLGDKVMIIEGRPFSREKRWWLSEIITRKEIAEIKPEEIS